MGFRSFGLVCQVNRFKDLTHYFQSLPTNIGFLSSVYYFLLTIYCNLFSTLNYFNYFSEIEDAFIRLRGKSLLLSPMDWALIEVWKESKIPLHIVLRSIDKVFENHEKAEKKRSIKGLAFCREEVEAQYAEWLERQVGKSESDETEPVENQPNQPFPHQTILEHLADSSENLRNNASNAASSETFLRVAMRLDELKEDFANSKQPSAEILEESLSSLENLLSETLLKYSSAETLELFHTETADSLKSYRKTMTKEAYKKTFDLMLLKKLRDKYDVPRLSLFYI